MQRRVLEVGALLALVITVAVVARGGDREAAQEVGGERATAHVVRTDIVLRQDLDGSIGHTAVDGGLVARGDGTVTALAAEGTVVEPGAPLFWLDGEPVLLLRGERPLSRDLVVGTSGDDVRMVNATFSLDGDEYTTATADAVRDAQRAAGGTPSGVLRPTTTVALPAPARVGAHEVTAGTAVTAGTTLAALELDEVVVSIDLDASERDRIASGDAVDVELPSGDVEPGRVRSVASVVDQPDDGDPTVAVVVVLDEAAAAAGLVGADVDVSITTDRAEDVLTVPVTALLALAEGGYAVEVLDGPDTALVGVDLGLFSDVDDLVEVSGALEEGDEVVVAS